MATGIIDRIDWRLYIRCTEEDQVRIETIDKSGIVCLTPDEARDLAELLLKHARMADLEIKRKGLAAASLPVANRSPEAEF